MEKEKLVEVGQMARSNHIWLNGFECINPSNEFKIKLAEQILHMLNSEGRLIKEESLPGAFSEMLYLSLNKS